MSEKFNTADLLFVFIVGLFLGFFVCCVTLDFTGRIRSHTEKHAYDLSVAQTRLDELKSELKGAVK